MAHEAGKGSIQRPTDEKKFRDNYDQIKWTKEEDEEFTRLQDRLSTERALADRNEKTIP